VGVRRLRLQAGCRSEAANVGSADLRRDDLVGTEESEEEVAVELLRIELSIRLLERLQSRRRTRAADDPEVTVDLVGGRELTHERSVIRRVERREHTLCDLAADCAE